VGECSRPRPEAGPLEELRGALARALAQEPRVLLLDEPFAELDPPRRDEMRELTRSLVEKTRTALVLVTHAREDVLALAEKVLVLEQGRAIAQGDLETLVREPRRPEVVRALGLGSIVRAEVTGPNEVATPAGRAPVPLGGRTGVVSVLVRPEQARVLSEEEIGGVAGEVVSVALAAPEARHLRHGVVVRLGETLVRARAASPPPRPGARVRVAIEGELVALEGGET
jgi:iron(III) transport system ATP-binding protein